MKEKRFNIGDRVTYKHTSQCYGGRYRHDGSDQGGYRGEILDYGSYNEEFNCYVVNVTSNEGFYYLMLEKEFMEWDGITYCGESMRHRFTINPCL